MENIIQKEGKLIAVYGRVSTSAQEVQETIEAQLLEVRKFAREHGYIIVKEYIDEGWSGDVLMRPSLDQLRLDAKKHMWEAVLIYDPDRLGRRYTYQEVVMDELKERGIDTLFVTIPPIKNENDQLFYEIRGSFARYERMKISERFRMGKLSRINQGHVLVTEAPYGYRYILNSGKKGTPSYIAGHFEVNNNEAKVLLDIFKWVADDGLTLKAVIKRLYEKDIRPRKSKRGIWSTSTLSTLLRNETFIGLAHWGTSYAIVPQKPMREQKYRKNKKTSRRMRPKSEWMTIKVAPIIDKELFDRTELKLRENFALLGRNKINNYLLSGKIWCTCGRRRTGEGPQHGKHLYYRCSDRIYCFPLPRQCHQKGINARIVDEAIWKRFVQIARTPKLMEEQVKRYLDKRRVNAQQESFFDFESTKDSVEKIKNQEDRYTKAYSEGVISLEKLKEYIAPLKEKLISLEKSLARASAEQNVVTEISLPNEEEIKKFSEEVSEYLDGLSFSSKKCIIQSAITKITSEQTDLQVHGLLNFGEIYVKLFTKDSDGTSTSSNVNLNNNYVKLFTSYSNRRLAKRREKYLI